MSYHGVSDGTDLRDMCTLIRTAWQARFEQDFVFALQCLEKFDSQYMSRLSMPEIKRCSLAFRRSIAHSILLRAWVQRREGNVTKSCSLFELAKEVVSKSEFERDFFFLFEGSCQALQKLDLSLALDLCDRAVQFAEDDRCRISAMVNLLGVGESLGLRNRKIEDHLTHFFLSEKHRSMLPLAYYGFSEFFQRGLFRSGQIQKLIDSVTDFDQKRGYVGYVSWVTSLPYVDVPPSSFDRCTSIDNFILNDRVATFKAFKQNTIQFIVDERDYVGPYMPLLCDRFYLWVWNWLVDPQRFPSSMWTLALRNLSLPTHSRLMSAEDRVLIANALSWLMLIAPKETAILESLILQLGVLNRRLFPLLEFEYLLIQHLKEKRLGEKSSHDLFKHSLFGAPGLRLSDLLKSSLDRSHPLFDLHRFLHRSDHVTNSDQISVVMGEATVEYRGRSCKSRSLSRAFLLLARGAEHPIRIDEFYRFAFERELYVGDQDDYRRIFNLLNRLKSYPQVVRKVSLSNGFLHCQIDLQNLVVTSLDVRERFVEELNWRSDGDSVFSISKERCDLRAEALEFIRSRHEVSRLDFERAFSLSRATASRQLQSLKNKNKIVQIGNGKQARYRMSLT